MWQYFLSQDIIINKNNYSANSDNPVKVVNVDVDKNPEQPRQYFLAQAVEVFRERHSWKLII